MTESERVAERLIEYRDNPPMRDCGAFEGRFYQTGDVMAIVMDPVAEFDGHEYITRLAALILGPKSDESEELASSVWASRAERLGARMYRAEKYAAETELENEKLRELVQYILDESYGDDWFYEKAEELGLEARY